MSRPNTPTYKTLNWPAYNKALIPQQSASNVVQAQDFIQLPEQQQTAVRTDL
jgi:hypothetical protein